MKNLYKIIQFLKFARLLLLGVLLLFVLAGKIVRADSVLLYYAGNGNYKGNFAATPLAACQLEFPQTTFIRPSKNSDSGNCLSVNQAGNNVELGGYSHILKTCEAKALTHNGETAGLPAPIYLHLMDAPSGIDAADWFSDRFNSCENNCVVLNVRYTSEHIPRVIKEKDGTTSSVFTKKQTGAVCVPEKQKPNEPPKPPRPADDNKPADDGKPADGADGQSGNNSGTGNGQGNNSGQSGSSSGNGTGSGNEGSGNSDNGKNGDGGGSGGGSGGSSGGGGTTGVPGGGTSGGQNGSGQADGSADGNDGQGNGQGGSGGESGDGSGEGSDQTGGNGAVDGGESDSEGSGGEDDKEGGSISGGNCDADQAPSCKGDPVQCYIAVEQWRTACAASGKNSSIKGGNCKTGTPPECKGDAAQCYIAEQQFINACEAQAQRDERAGLKSYADSKKGMISEVEGSSVEGAGQALKDNSGTLDLTNIIDRSGLGLGRSCPASPSVDAGIFGIFEIDYSLLCTMAQILGKVFSAMCMLFAVRYIFA